MTFRFKRTRKRHFYALHNVVDTDTLMITAARVRARPGGDAKQLVPLVRGWTVVDLKPCMGTRPTSHDRTFNVSITWEHIQPSNQRRGLRVRSRGHRGCKGLISEYRSDPEEWKGIHEYGMRSLAETVFGMIEVRFTERMGS